MTSREKLNGHTVPRIFDPSQGGVVIESPTPVPLPLTGRERSHHNGSGCKTARRPAASSIHHVDAAPKEPHCLTTRWQRTEQHAFEFGQAYDSYFATETGWKRFWSNDRSGLVSYRRSGKYVKVIGGLLAHPDDKPRLLREFLDFTKAHKLIATFFNITEEDAALFQENGCEVTKWGEEAFVDLQECTWSGKQFEWVRRQTNYCRRAGITIVEHCREDMDKASWESLIHRVRAVSDELLATKSHSGTIKLIEGQLEAEPWGGRRLFVAYSGAHPRRIEGFLVALPMDNGRKCSFEMYRHRVDCVRGVVPHLFHEVMMRLKAEGVKAVSLCLVPAIRCEKPRPGDNAMTRIAFTVAKNHLNFLFDFAGIYHFKTRFRPRFENRFICAFPKTTLGSSFALFRMTGMLDFSWKKTGASLLQKFFKRHLRLQLADRAPSLSTATPATE